MKQKNWIEEEEKQIECEMKFARKKTLETTFMIHLILMIGFISVMSFRLYVI